MNLFFDDYKPIKPSASISFCLPHVYSSYATYHLYRSSLNGAFGITRITHWGRGNEWSFGCHNPPFPCYFPLVCSLPADFEPPVLEDAFSVCCTCASLRFSSPWTQLSTENALTLSMWMGIIYRRRFVQIESTVLICECINRSIFVC